MQTQKFPLAWPNLEELAEILKAPLEANFAHSTVTVAPCPNLRDAPFYLATEGLSGDEKVADVGGQPNLFPRPRLGCKWSMTEIAKEMEMSSEKGSLVGAGAGPFHVVGQNSELAPNLGWEAGFQNVTSGTRVAKITRDIGAVSVEKITSSDCALMVNLFGSSGSPGPVLKITAKARTGPEKSFTECIRKGLASAYGDSRAISLGGVFLVKSGRARYHVMPDFPSEQDLPFRDRQGVEEWLTYHEFDAPMVCLSVLHSADPNGLGLRMEHTHAFSPLGKDAGGHYHYDVAGGDEEVEYEAYFNTAKTLYRIDQAGA